MDVTFDLKVEHIEFLKKPSVKVAVTSYLFTNIKNELLEFTEKYLYTM